MTTQVHSLAQHDTHWSNDCHLWLVADLSWSIYFMHDTVTSSKHVVHTIWKVHIELDSLGFRSNCISTNSWLFVKLYSPQRHQLFDYSNYCCLPRNSNRIRIFLSDFVRGKSARNYKKLKNNIVFSFLISVLHSHKWN